MNLVLKCFLNDYTSKYSVSSLLGVTVKCVCVFPQLLESWVATPACSCSGPVLPSYAWAEGVTAAGETAEVLDVRTLIPSKNKTKQKKNTNKLQGLNLTGIRSKMSGMR